MAKSVESFMRNILIALGITLQVTTVGCNDSQQAANDRPAPDSALEEVNASALRADLKEAGRMESGINRAEELLLAKSGDVLVVRGLLDVEVWDLKNRQVLWEGETDLYDHHIPPVDNELVWVRQSNGKAEVVHSELRTGMELKSTPLEFTGVKLWNVTFGWGERPLVAGQEESPAGGRILIFAVGDGKLLKRFDMPREEDGSPVTIRGFAVSPSGNEFLITASSSVILCDDAGRALQRYSTKGNVSRLLFLNRRRWALACGEVFGSPLYFLNLEDGSVAQENEHRWDAVSLDVSPDEKWAVTGGRSRFAADRNYYLRTSKDEGGEVILWDVAARKPVAKVHPCVDTVGAVAISSDGLRLAVAEEGDGTGQIVIFEIDEK